jgi:hypothetical protein
MMNNKERVLATLKGEPTDQLPYIPRLDLWYKANKVRGTLPDQYRNASLFDIVDDLGIGYHHVVPDFLDFIDPLDELDRCLGIYRLRTLPYRILLRGIKRNVFYDGDVTTVEYITPYGNVSGKVLYDDSMRRAGVTITHVFEQVIKSVEDYKAVAYIFENAEVLPAYDQYLIAKEEVGDRGVAVAWVSLSGSPMHLIQKELMSYELFFYELYDHPNLAAAADVLHGNNKFLLTHTDGENKGLLECYLESRIDIADSICPAPMTSLTLKEAREAFNGKITIWGGIPSISVLENSMSDYEFEAYLDRVFSEEIGRGDHLILSIADTTPPDAKCSRIEQIAKLAQEFGPVRA